MSTALLFSSSCHQRFRSKALCERKAVASICRCLVFGSLFFGGTLAFAQNGSIQGIVTDSSGAAVSNVQVVLKQKETGTSTSTLTNDAGLYSFPLLKIGHYLVSASKPGFQTAESEQIELSVGQERRIDLSLQPGNISERVTVSSSAPAIDTESTAVGQVINNRTLVNLPLNGRNYLELATLTSGTAPAVGSRTNGAGAFSASGQHGWQTNVQLDGVDNNSRESGGQLGYEAQSVTPSVDAVNEFRVVTNNLSAEYGGRMGGTVIVNLKSGSNQFHGSAFEFLRNSALDATNFFANLNGADKPVFKRNQFGGTLGGPIVRDKLFFFGSYEGTRIRNGKSFVSTVPTLAERQGDFSQVLPVYDPASTTGSGGSITRQPFSGNIIPTSRWDPLFPNLLALYPLPVNNSTANNYFYSPVEKNSTDSYDGRLDFNLNDMTRFWGRYSFRNTSGVDPGPLPLPADGGQWQTVDLQSQNLVASLTRTVSATVTNEFRFGYTRTRSVLDIPESEALFNQYGITGIPQTNNPASNDHGLTLFAPSGYAQLGSMAYWPNFNNLDFYQFSDILYKSAGSHTIKIGADAHHERQLRQAARFARGQFSFTREFTQDPQHRSSTGDGLAEFMLGLAGGGTLGNENGEDLAYNWIDGFIQDDWRLTRRLTLNLGLRYDVFLGATFPNGNVSNFLLDFSSTGPNARLTSITPENSSDCGCDQDLNNVAPRVGFAWQLTPKTVVRSGFGIIYGQPDSMRKEGSHFTNQAPQYVEYSFATLDRIQPRLVLSQGFPAIQLPATSVPGPASVGISANPAYLPTQYSEQWFFDVQRELPWGLVTTLGYTGDGTHHLIGGINYNLPTDGPSPVPVAQRRRWPYYTGVSSSLAFGNLSYNAFTWRVEKRFAQGLQFLSAYTWSHTIDNLVESNNDTPNQGSVDPYNRSLDRANSITDIRHNLVLSGYYELPFGRGKRWMNRGGFLNAALGGWQVSGVFSARSGAPFTVVTTGNITNAGGADRPNRLGSGALPESERSIYRWFNLSDFAVQPQYTYGNAGRNILVGPGLRNLDLTLAKVFPIREALNIQFRMEAFNLSNTPAFGQPNATLNTPSAGTITSAGDPRRLQLALKLLW